MRIGPFGLPELLIILVLVLLFFGPKRLPEMAKGIGQAVREFRKSVRDISADINGDGAATPAAPAPAAPAPARAATSSVDSPAEQKAG
jgi:sec-independent protein translocase protein TatA